MNKEELKEKKELLKTLKLMEETVSDIKKLIDEGDVEELVYEIGEFHLGLCELTMKSTLYLQKIKEEEK